MSNLDLLLSLGAKSTAGDLILNGKLLGRVRDGDVQLTPEGREIIKREENVTDVVPKAEKKPRKKAEPVVEAAPAEAAPVESLDDLLS